MEYDKISAEMYNTTYTKFMRVTHLMKRRGKMDSLRIIEAKI